MTIKGATTVTSEQLASEIVNQFRAFKDVLDVDVSQAVQDTANEAVKELRNTSPKRTGRYAKGWRVKMRRGYSFTQAIIHNKDRYQLAHLLEHGHALRQGGRAPAIPHIAPAEQTAKERLLEAIARVMRGAQ